MTITTRDELINSMGNDSSRLILDKVSVTGQAAGTFVSMWRITGQPGQGAIPTVKEVCTHATAGAVSFTQQLAPKESYLGILETYTASAGQTIEIHDRLMQMGGLSGIVITAQSVNIDLSTELANNNMAARIGDSNYSDVQWWLEWYTATGATVVNANVSVVYSDGTAGTISVQLTASRPASHMIPLNGLIPSAIVGKYIRAVTSIQLSATTGTAGNFGVTATRYRAANYNPVANSRFTSDWAQLGFPKIANSSCLVPIMLTTGTTTGLFRATGKIIHG